MVFGREELVAWCLVGVVRMEWEPELGYWEGTGGTGEGFEKHSCLQIKVST